MVSNLLVILGLKFKQLLFGGSGAARAALRWGSNDNRYPIQSLGAIGHVLVSWLWLSDGGGGEAADR